MNQIRLIYKGETEKLQNFRLEVNSLLLSVAWRDLVRVCTSEGIPIPTEEDYKAGRLTKTIIQE